MDEALSETVVPADVEEAWEAVTDPDHLGEWLGDDASIELEPGGDVAVRVGDEEREGFVEEVDAPRRLVFWWSADGAEASRVEISLEPGDEGETRVRVVESRPLRVLDAGGDLLERIGGGAGGVDAGGAADGAGAPELRALALAR